MTNPVFFTFGFQFALGAIVAVGVVAIAGRICDWLLVSLLKMLARKPRTGRAAPVGSKA